MIHRRLLSVKLHTEKNIKNIQILVQEMIVTEQHFSATFLRGMRIVI